MNSDRFAEISTNALEEAFNKATSHGHRGVVEIFMGSERFDEMSAYVLETAFTEAASQGHRFF